MTDVHGLVGSGQDFFSKLRRCLLRVASKIPFSCRKICPLIMIYTSSACHVYKTLHFLNRNLRTLRVFWRFNFWRHHKLVWSGRVSTLLVIGGSHRIIILFVLNRKWTRWHLRCEWILVVSHSHRHLFSLLIFMMCLVIASVCQTILLK